MEKEIIFVCVETLGLLTAFRVLLIEIFCLAWIWHKFSGWSWTTKRTTLLLKQETRIGCEIKIGVDIEEFKH
jgi:hypothetical protein